MSRKRKIRIFPLVALILSAVLLLSTIVSVLGWMKADSNYKKTYKQLGDIQSKLTSAEKERDEAKKERDEKSAELESTSFKIKDLQNKIEQLEKDKTTAVDEAKRLQLENDRLNILNGLEVNGLKLVALTFDDGPSKFTPRLLDLLKSKKMKATFFVLGSNAEKLPAVVKRAVDEGHEVGNHSYIHKFLDTLTPDGISADMTKSTNAIEKATGVKVKLMRPPGGRFNNDVKKFCVDNGLANIMWHVDTRDWDVRDAQKTFNNAFNGSSNTVKDGAIVLMHDIKDVYVDGASLIMNRLEEEKYVTVTVSQLLALRADGGIAGESYRLLPPKK